MVPTGSEGATSDGAAGDAGASTPARRRDLRFFSSPSGVARGRRPTDVVLLAASLVVLGVMAAVASSSSALEDGLRSVAASLPGLLGSLAQVAHDLALVWAVCLVVVAAAAHRRASLLRDLLLAAGLVLGVGAVAHRVVQGEWPSLLAALGDADGPLQFPALRLALATAVVVTASPHLSRPVRYAGRWILAAAALATVCLGVALPGGVLAALALGAAVASTVHLAFGSPGGRPTVDQVAAALLELGVQARNVQPADLQPHGVWMVSAESPDGARLDVKVYGRDAWDSQLVTTVWRFLWYRDAGADLPVSRIQQVEHEAFLSLLAQRAGVHVADVVAAGRTESGDALLVTLVEGPTLATAPAVDAGVLDRLWTNLGVAHQAGLSPGRLDAEAIRVAPTGEPVLAEWAGGSVCATDPRRRADRARLLVATAVRSGDEAAVAAAQRAIGASGLADLVGYLQPAALSRALRKVVRSAGYDLDGLRRGVASAAGVDLPELVPLRRVTWGSLIQLALFALAATALVKGLSGLDFAAVADELQSLSVAGAVLGLALAQLARASGALSTIGASSAALPVGPVVLLQFAIGYVNLAVPTTAGRLAVMARFFQRVGAGTSGAFTTSALDSLGNFAVQVGILVATFVFSLGSLEIDVGRADVSIEADLVAVVVALLAAAAAAVAFIPRLRRAVLPSAAAVRRALAVLRSPSRVGLLLGGNLLTQVLYALSLGACTQAMGARVGLADLVIINTLVSLFAGLMPIPGGIGVTEAGLTAGLVLAGVPETTALAAVLVYRVASFYLPPVWGWFAMRSLRRANYL